MHNLAGIEEYRGKLLFKIKIARRFQLFEFCDLASLPRFMREGFQDCLGFVHKLYKPYRRLSPKIAEWLDGHVLLDIASGRGEQIREFLINLSEESASKLPQVTLSDLYPDCDAYRRLQQQFGQNVISFYSHPFPIQDLNCTDQRYWSIFTALHHFDKDLLTNLFKAVLEKADGLCIVEPSSRRLSDLIGMLLGFPFHMLAPFFSRRFSFLKFIFTSIIPLIPFMVTFDGVVSVLRTYSKEELIELFPLGLKEEFSMKYYETTWGLGLMKASLLLLKRKTAGLQP